MDKLNELIGGTPPPEPGSLLDAIRRGEPNTMTPATFKELSTLIREADERAPRCHGFLAHHAVPYGKLYRQWDTKGRLWCWVNKGWIADMPHAAKKSSWVPGDHISDIYAVPVIDVHAVNRRLQFGESDE